MRVVIDTNVLMSAIFFGGTPGRILKVWRAGQIDVVMSPEIVDEYVRVGERLRQRYLSADIQPLIELIIQNAEIVPSSLLPDSICEDPEDDKFLARALEAKVKVVISGDKKLLAVSAYQGIAVVTPRQFVDRWLRKMDTS